ncbi:conserved Plasmodium protein, unknown function [Plasmodium vivax]|uniref:Uncharacterized protein n=5 Tax=Plasmodium vivax TaxID=5855 RepID=A5K7P7_PLAVS|nr:hypothetical protein, conserved [Plasmodium vivax]KMZ87085.1 hypothetical protein PVBG_02926 [Plasmodium vivax Brazil I]KMZ93520.1 hypothetical protein PVMG_00966 [Plasmodium vivax Mauritania I]KNA00009.1 hypothetical protein PVNG_03393 [Plasmodium vivax North Korean]EDL44806.1 hypothetical protein, conserved [Plasmodium vivax]SCO66942.1 conserved Plasmodium protein, unknown function [Plasmodium vivax]|eukprot:XP_001614533.1 hypothetical protein [Plasmodium vivax Sal-1]
MLGALTPPISSVRRRPLFHNQKRFAYYRFHKRVGKGSWSKYVERFKPPRSIENTQRLIFNYEPTYSEKKASCSWQWLLPKKIAQATTSDEVLNVWVYYRHKRKKAYHYIKALKRLVDVGTCSTSDWRFKLITSRVQNKINTFLNLPRICYYYGRLKATAQLEGMSKMINHRLSCYLPHQLILILRSFALCELQDKQLFCKIRDQLKPHVSTLSFFHLSEIAKSYAACMIHDFLFLGVVADEVMLRVRLCNESSRSRLGEYNTRGGGAPVGAAGAVSSTDASSASATSTAPAAPPGEGNLVQHRRGQFCYYPQMESLIEIAVSFANLKFQNYPFFDCISRLTMYMLRDESRNALNPFLLEKIASSFSKLKINDVRLFEHILRHIGTYTYDYPPHVLSSIGCLFSYTLPIRYRPINRIYKKMMPHIYASLPILNMDGLTKFSSFVHKGVTDRRAKKEFLFRVNDAVKRAENRHSKMMYDAPRLLEILTFHGLLDGDSFQIICKHMHGNIKYFEPCDFNRAARALNLAKRKFTLEDAKIVNALARNAIKQFDLFHIIDYHQFCKSILNATGLKDAYRICLVKHHNSVPFFGFDELTLEGDIPSQEKKNAHRYRKGTIRFANKRFEQEYPLHRSLAES